MKTKYPVISRLLARTVRSASDADVKDLTALEEDLRAAARKVERTVGALAKYVNVPTKIALVAQDLQLYAYEIGKSRSKLSDKIAPAPQPEVAPEVAPTPEPKKAEKKK